MTQVAAYRSALGRAEREAATNCRCRSRNTTSVGTAAIIAAHISAYARLKAVVKHSGLSELAPRRRAQVHRSGSVRVSELTQLFGVSDMTIRRDLDVLARRGLLAKVHGGDGA